MQYRKIEEMDFCKILANVGYIVGCLESSENMLNAIGMSNTLDDFRNELHKELYPVLKIMQKAKLVEI